MMERNRHSNGLWPSEAPKKNIGTNISRRMPLNEKVMKPQPHNIKRAMVAKVNAIVRPARRSRRSWSFIRRGALEM